ncbi:MAG: hypothetical protein CMO80_01750 [Verrucomicrobiales bacterium]|nr:hypothetical protein [Verrucomicrobiales bacterium]|tara:strand:- start:8002 stop:9831 length:1830 start_codon:yes stop_codon:yes gene_type:complete
MIEYRALTPMKHSIILLLGLMSGTLVYSAERPNILWILGEDASPHIGCYGEKLIKTPHLDKLASEGIRFENAFVTCPVCSPSRSAMVTGMYQTTLGVHNHRSQNENGKGGGYPPYFDSYRLPVKSIPELLREAGYFVTNGSGPACKKNGKTDYNFTTPNALYDGADWRKAGDKPFFAQIQLKGGKSRNKRQSTVDASKVKLPPYYPDHPVLREDWAVYLNSWIDQDRQVGEIMESLAEAGVAENTVVFFLTDHGVSHARGKQFLYEEGIRVPLIVRFPDGRSAATVRNDLVIHIDLAATSLALAGIKIPDRLQGVDLFAKDYQPRNHVITARDRCDETVEILRSVRTKRYKYIRNFMSHVPHLQPSQYKDGKEIVQTIKQLHAGGKLNELQSRLLVVPRPLEELYDLKNDPHETINLAAQPKHAKRLAGLRASLADWMIESRDLGLFPEPLLEDFGRASGNKYQVLRSKLSRGALRSLLSAVEAAERGEVAGLNDTDPSIRFWTATWAGVNKKRSLTEELKALLDDDHEAIQISAALALCRMKTDTDRAIAVLVKHLDSSNPITGMYAIRGIEWSGVRNAETMIAANKAAKGKYEFTRRIGRRLQNQHW